MCRIRQEGTVQVPEVLPLGTYTWSVNITGQQKQKSEGHKPLLFYDVITTYCKDKIHVFNYVQPHATLNCYSPMASLIPHYNTLLAMRELRLNSVAWNAKPKIALEEQVSPLPPTPATSLLLLLLASYSCY